MFFLTHLHITHPNPTSSPSAMGTRWQAGGLRRSGHSRGHRHRQAPSMVRRGGCAEGWGRARGRGSSNSLLDPLDLPRHHRE
jgi:hypothetical protein